jgi:flagellar protein FlgJ
MLDNIASADVYTDFNGLAKLKLEAKQQTPAAIKEVARQFESVFIGMVLKSMREASGSEGGILDNNQSKFYQEMHDQQLSVHLAGEPGIGLAALIERQLSPKQYEMQDKLGLTDYQERPVMRADPIKARPVAVNSDKAQPIASAMTREIKSPQDFVRELQAAATQAAKALGVDSKVLLAQAALETGWGKNVIKMTDGQSSFNLFNIKAHNNWTGKQATINTLEYDKGGVARQEKARFRAYDSYQDSFNDYVRFIKENPRYQQALKQRSEPEQYMHELQAAGYATDPVYANKVMRIYHSETLSNLDKLTAMTEGVKE